MSKAELKKIQSNIILGILCLICITIGNNIIGSFGTTCLAFTVCMFLSVYAVLISWIPDYMTKMVRFRVLKEQYKYIGCTSDHGDLGCFYRSSGHRDFIICSQCLKE